VFPVKYEIGLYIQEDDILLLRSVGRLLVTANVPSTPILITLMFEALSSSETSVLTIATLRNIPEHAILHTRRRVNLKSYIDILHSHRCENLKSYVKLTGWAL
jgi:hypothetical protein